MRKGISVPPQPVLQPVGGLSRPAMAWFPDYQYRLQWTGSNGLPVTFTEARCDPSGFAALYCRIGDDLLPRSNACRGFELHITVGVWSEFKKCTTYEQLEVLLGEVNARWAGVHHVL